MALGIGEAAPDFTAPSTSGTISLHEYLGDSWGVLFSYAADFTPVSITELAQVAQLQQEFDRRGIKLLAVGTDDLESHERFLADVEGLAGVRPNFPLVADIDKEATDLYGFIQPHYHPTFSMRGVFLISPDKKVKMFLFYPGGLGRDFREILRAAVALKLNYDEWVSTPAGWNDGDDVIVFPSTSDDDAIKRFGSFTAVTPYLRLVPQPVSS